MILLKFVTFKAFYKFVNGTVIVLKKRAVSACGVLSNCRFELACLTPHASTSFMIFIFYENLIDFIYDFYLLRINYIEISMVHKTSGHPAGVAVRS